MAMSVEEEIKVDKGLVGPTDELVFEDLII